MTSRTRCRLALAGLVVAAVIAAWVLRFGTDDAYISFTYAKRLVENEGLTWFGTRIEGYTNFLWVMWSALGLMVDADPLVWSWIGSLAALAAAIVTTFAIARLRAGPVAAFTAAAILATNYTFIAFGTSGLETMLQTALIAGVMWQVEQLRRGPLAPRRLALTSVLVALALATRLDSAVPCSVLGVALAHRMLTERVGRRAWLAAIVPAAVLVGGWFAWKLAYYGDILPNTFYAKAGSSHLAHGLLFIWWFVYEYMLLPVLAAIAIFAIARRRFASWLPLAILVTWLLYIVDVGGDFMEFRFFVPVLPAIAILIAEAVVQEAPPRVPKPAVRAAFVVGWLAAWSVHHAIAFDQASDGSCDSIEQLGNFYGKVEHNDWSRIGAELGYVLYDTGAIISCNGAGAIPYFSDVPTIDQLGLNDAWVARNGIVPPPEYTRPGHQRYATFDYLESRHVNFVIGSPTYAPRGALETYVTGKLLRRWMANFTWPAPVTDKDVMLVGAPIDDTWMLLMMYIRRTPEIDKRIKARGWEMLYAKHPPAAKPPSRESP